MAVVQGCQAVLLGAKGSELSWGVGQLTKAPAQIAINAVLLDAVGHHLDRFDAGTVQVLHTVLANEAGKAFNLVANAADQLTAVTPAGAPTNASSLQQYY
ncbi:hypothetical protein D3C77_633120 [compost metagenome]